MITHRLLKRQIRKSLGEDPDLSPEVARLLATINTTYEQHDADRKLLQRSMDLSSDELLEANEQLSQETAKQAWHELGVAALLSKPIKPAQLHAALMALWAGEQARPQPVSRPGAVDPEMGRRHPLRILLAEDNVVNQKVALRMLERLGYRADLASNGLEVLEALDRQAYDVVLMDVQMPELDGLAATRRICRRWPIEERPRIVAMTAGAMRGDRDQCLEAGMDGYVSKPVKLAELVQALRVVLGVIDRRPSTRRRKSFEGLQAVTRAQRLTK